MPDYKIRLTHENIKAAEDAARVFSLYDLERDKSCSFLNERKWKAIGPDFRYDDWGKKADHVSLRAYESFMFINELGVMKAHGMAYGVDQRLRKALICLKDRNLPVIASAKGGPVAFFGCRDEPALDGMTVADIAVQATIFLVQERSAEALEALHRGDDVYLLPPGYEWREYEPDRRYAHLFR